MRTIWDIEQLRPLESIRRRYGVTFRLRGGVAFRLLLSETWEEELRGPIDLFELTPFTSDVDLIHSGPPELTPMLLERILAEVPAGECFRWELQSAKLAPAFAMLAGCNLVPARLVEITDNQASQLLDPANGADDISKLQFRYYRNPLFKQSVRYRQGRDIEAFSALLYLQTLGESGIPLSDFANQPGWQALCSVFKERPIDVDFVGLLQQHAYLRSRLRHLLRSTVTAFADARAATNAAQLCGLSDWLRHLAASGTIQFDLALSSRLGLTDERRDLALFASDRLVGDMHRLDAPIEPWTSKSPSGVTLPELSESESVLLISPELSVQPGTSTVRTASFGEPIAVPAIAQEFIYVQLPEVPFEEGGEPGSLIRQFSDSDLGAFLLLKGPDGWTPFALPAVVLSKRMGSSLSFSIRMNCLNFLAAVATREVVKARLVLVRWGASGS